MCINTTNHPPRPYSFNVYSEHPPKISQHWHLKVEFVKGELYNLPGVSNEGVQNAVDACGVEVVIGRFEVWREEVSLRSPSTLKHHTLASYRI